jgi:diguanylate cyclase (GGDEF)-like protein
VLATAANLIAEHGRQLIRTTVVVSPILRAALPAERTISLAPAPAADIPRVTEVTGNLLVEAINQFERAVERRAEMDTAENADLLKVAGLRIRDQAEAFLEEINTPDIETRARALRPRVRDLRNAGDEVVRIADDRRAVLAGYWSHFESADAQVKKALDQNNWKIFGRVISRQSLSGLSRELDDIRRGSTQLNTAGEDAAMLDSLAQSQAHFAAALDRNASGLARSQGAAWVESLRKEFGAVLENRKQLAQLDNQNPRGVAPLERGAEELAGLVRGIGAAARKQASRTGPRPGVRVIQTGSSDAVEAGDATGVPQPAALAKGSGSTSTAAGDAQQGTLPSSAGDQPDPPPTIAPERVVSAVSDGVMIAFISGLVLLILFVISVATVRSVVIPIRQFMTTTELLAGGDESARFTRGGIKELDALAISFNRMAESLAEARAMTREYQGELESRVDERTRQLQHLAEHDPLTGLPNRRHLVAHLNASLYRAARNGQRLAVFFLDLDNFKNINDSMGHAFGDLVLKGVGQRLREAAAVGGFAARIGGDEFTVIQENAGGHADVSEAGNALVRAFQKPLLIEGRELMISISGGASIYPDHERGSDALLRAADAALFRAKNSGRARLSLFSPELLEAASLKFSLEQGLRRALEREEFELWFQPEVSFDTLETKLVEALLRWRLPDGQYVAPNDFLSVAEDSGLIRSINDWVLRTAFRHAAEWHDGAWPEARVAINVSARQLLDTSFVARIRELLEEYSLPPRCIEIELTESVLQTEAATIEILGELRRLDISIALDDFGSGYSSLSSLERLPLTRVKLDRSLIDTIDTSSRSLAIARAIVGLCENLGLEVTAEGVERPEQLALLLGNPAMTLQGYLLSHPLKAQIMPGALRELRERLQSLLITVPAAKDATTVAARDAATLAGKEAPQAGRDRVSRDVAV